MEDMELSLKEIFSGKKVMVTGHTGFKGSWLITWLHALGAEIKGYSLKPKNEFDLYYMINGDAICNSVIADIRDKERVESEIISFQPDFIFHLAAQPLVRLSYEIPDYTIAVNVGGTVNLLEALRVLNKPCSCVMITTDKVYENLELGHRYCENDKLGGFDPYSASKAAAELVISSYRNSFFNPEKYEEHYKSISVARAGNVIGGGDWSNDRIIPDIINGLINNKQIRVRNPLSVRPWQYVLDPLYGYLRLAAIQFLNPTKHATAYNFGPNPEKLLTVKKVVEMAISIWRSGSYCEEIIARPVHEAVLLQLDISKAKMQLGWSPKYDQVEAINRTIGWYKNNYSDRKSGFQSLIDEIDQYSKLIK